jgi:DNA-binding CsgD family transcriptional regulator
MARRPELAIRLAGYALFAQKDQGFARLNARVLRGAFPGNVPVEYTEMAIADLGAEMRARISLSDNPRLTTALKENQTTIEEELPSALAEVVHTLKDMSDLDKFRNHVTNLIAGPERRAERKRHAYVPIEDFPSAEDFEARELARIDYQERWARTKLTDREREFPVLRGQGYHSDEIAKSFGTTANSVDVTVNKARNKLRQTA